MNAEGRLEVLKRWHWSALVKGVVTFDIDNCKVGECIICGLLVCPHAEPLHFHHDGCPACHLPHDLEADCGPSCADDALMATRVPSVGVSVSRRVLRCRACGTKSVKWAADEASLVFDDEAIEAYCVEHEYCQTLPSVRSDEVLL
jgi:hypothetical protein